MLNFSEEKREELSAVMSEASDWIWDVEEPTAIVYQDKLAELKKATKEWRKRVDEYQRRPEIIENLQVSMRLHEIINLNLSSLVRKNKRIRSQKQVNNHYGGFFARFWLERV